MPGGSFFFIGNGTGLGVETAGRCFVAFAGTADACFFRVLGISNARLVIYAVSVNGTPAKEVCNGR